METKEVLEILQKRRIELQITYRRLMWMTGITEANLIRYLKGDINLGMNNFLKLCDALGIEIDFKMDKNREPFQVKRHDRWQKNIEEK